jgi:hypothetical protein
MAISPRCDSCRKTIDEFGALVFGPPKAGNAKKFHVCVDCYQKIFLPILLKQTAKKETRHQRVESRRAA